MQLSKKALSIEASPTLAVDTKAKKMMAEGIDVIGFGVGEPDFNTPQAIIEAAKQAMDAGFTKYTPASGTPELKQAICDKLKRDNGLDYSPAQIVVSNGAKHSLTNTFSAILNPGDEVLIPAPFWVSYPEMVKLADGKPVIVHATEAQDFKVSAAMLEAAITDKTKAIILNSPGNPTGMIYFEEELRDIAHLAVRNNLFVISDEIYEALIYDGHRHVSIASFGEDIKAKTIVINGMSKAYAMTGWRIGYAASNTNIATVMANLQSQSTSNPNSIAQKASVAALNGDKSDIVAMREEFFRRRNLMVQRINAIEGLSCIVPQGAFYTMMNVKGLFGKKYQGKTIENASQLAEILLEGAHVATVSGSSFGAEGYLRLSYATSQQNIEKGLRRIAAWIHQLS